MSGIFPQAKNLNQYWDNLINGVESIMHFAKNEEDSIRAAAVLDDIDCFDAKFFNYSAYEAEIMDPQQRLFLECCWNALEDAGYSPEQAGNVGVFAGSNISTYFLLAQQYSTGKIDSTHFLQLLMGNDKDYLATRISYKLNLTGPSVCVQSACSTSLLSIHTAVQSLLNGECEMALAGGVNISVPQALEYEYKEGMIFSPDGHCRAFDADAQGTVAGNGVGAVVLKRLSDAIEDGDTIDAVILGSAVNNDGARKIGYTAPSIEGQCGVIAQAIALADVPVDTIDYIEAHGTGTPLGDPIEIRSLTQVFQDETEKTGYCAIGSVKSNIGHLNSAAGIASFIKTVLALKNEQIPPSLHYKKANPEIDFPNTPFFVNHKASDWPQTNHPRRAGVSSFGFGGTNVHMILEQAPQKEQEADEKKMKLVVLSAQSQHQLRTLAQNYEEYLNLTSESLNDIAFTSMEGRKHHSERLAVVAKNKKDLQSQLQSFLNNQPSALTSTQSKKHNIKTACLFTGQGSSYANMAQGLYNSNSIFRDSLNLCAQKSANNLDVPLLNLLFGNESETSLLSQTKYAQPALFSVGYGLYQMYKAMGVVFDVLAGHSVGEIVAACVAGVFELDDALQLICARGRLVQSLPLNHGGMVTVFANEQTVQKYMKEHESLCLAAYNGPEHFVLSAELSVLEQLIEQLIQDEVNYVKLKVSHAFHSVLLEPILDEFESLVSSFSLKEPQIPIVSNLYGRLVKENEITRASYWREHMRQPVQFMKSIQSLEAMGVNCFLECGPHPVLTNMAKQCTSNTPLWIASLQRNQNDEEQILHSASLLYTHGLDIKWKGLSGKNLSQRVSIPTYPFDKQRYWLADVAHALEEQNSASQLWQSVIDSGNVQAIKGGKQLDIMDLRGDERVLIALAQSFIINAFRSLNVFTQDRKYTLNEILKDVIPQYHQLVQRFLEELHAVGLVQINDQKYWNLSYVSDELLASQKEACADMFAKNQTFETVFISSGEQLGDVLKGKTKAIDAMMMGTSLDEAKEIYADLPTSFYFNALLRETVKTWVDSMPKNAPLRILEIGSGTGATSEQLLPLLPKERSTYYYTDVSPLFLQRASKVFETYDFVNYSLFDINKTPKEQGFDLHSFDLIIASNVLHAADDLHSTMGNVSKLLKPNGMLFMYEIVKETLIGEITTGLLLPVVKDTELRGIQPFMTKNQWESLLMELGFRTFHSIPEDHLDTAYLGERILLAQQQESIVEQEENNCFYQLQWDKNQSILPSLEEALITPSNWVICSDKKGYAKELSNILTQHNHTVSTVELTVPFAQLKAQINEAFNDEKPVQIVYLWGVNDVDLSSISASQLQEQQGVSCLRLLDILAILSQRDLTLLQNLSVITNGTQSIGTMPNENIALSESTLWGFTQVVALGHPELHVKLIDLDAKDTMINNSNALLQNLMSTHNTSQYQCILRGNHSYFPRVRNVEPSLMQACHEEINADENGWYLIAGGLGGLGLKTAAWLIEKGAKHILLVGRNTPSKKAQEEINHFKHAGVVVQIAQADITDYEALKKVTDNLELPLKGIIHSAVVRDTQTLGQMPQEERTLAVISPKLEGAWNLHQISLAHEELDMFILYSSSVSLVPARGLPEYVASNVFLDALANYRKAQNLPALSISWGAWAEVGTVAKTNQEEQLKQNGLSSMNVQQSFECLEQILQSDSPWVHFGVMDVDWSKLLQNHPKDQLSSYFKDVLSTSYIEKQVNTQDNLAQHQHKLLQNLENAATPEQSLDFIVEYLKQKVSVLLRLDVNEVPVEKDLLHLGIDSLMFLDLLNNLNQVLQVKVKPNDVMANLTVNAISEHLLKARQSQAVSSTQELLVVDKEALNEPFALTDIQQAYWIGRDQHMDLGNVACHGYMEIECQDLDIELLQMSWNKIIQRHEMLRCIILPFGQQQILDDVDEYEFTQRDFTSLSKDEREESLANLRTRLSHRVPRTDQWPLFDIHATKLQNGITRLHISLDNIMTDGKSIGIMLSEWVHMYYNPAQQLPQLSLSFRDYVMSFEAYKQTDDFAKSKQYWLDKLDEVYPSPQLPLSKNSSEVKNPTFVRREFHLSQEKWERLRSFASQKAGLTPSGILLSVYAQVLSLWSNSAKFTLNVPTFNRLAVHPAVNDIIGEFTSLILLSVDYSKNLSFKDQANQLQKQLFKDQAHDAFSGVAVMRELSRHSKPASMPVVFTSTFGLTQNVNTTFSEHEQQAQELGKQIYTISQTPQVYIDNHVHDHGGTLNVYWDCVDELFPDGMLDDMFEAYGKLLEQLASNEEIWESNQPIALPKKQQELYLEYNDTANSDYLPKKDDLLSGFLHHVERLPHETALVANGESLSYQELFKRACFMAHELKQTSFNAKDKVAVILPKGWQQIASVIAILGTKGIYVPFDASLPQKRLEQLIHVSEVEYVITTKEIQSKLDSNNNVSFIIPALTWTQKEETVVQHSGVAFTPSNNEELAYVIYTSGSTGEPKGVMTSHKAALNTILDVNERFNVNSNDVIFGLSGLHFDLSVYDVFGSLNAGACLVLPNEEDLKDPNHWLEMISQYNITVWNSVPALCQMLLMQAGANGSFMQSLKRVMLSGDWIPLSLKDELNKHTNNARLYSLGGATEAAIWSIYYEVEEVDASWSSIPYGMPLANQQFYVLNERLQECPLRVVGDLYIGGEGLALGYCNDEQKTNEAFIIHPKTGKRLYKTGDKGRLNLAGYMEFLGREDFQVKINGHRIELGEIEASLLQHESVKSAVVTAIDAYGNSESSKDVKHNKQKLVAYCVCRKDTPLDIQEELKQWLSERLPNYMVPNYVFMLDALPLTSNGKLDRKALPLPSHEQSSKTSIAKTDNEKLLVSLWQEILHIQSIYTNSDFFDLGGDSLQATRLSVALQEEGLNLGVNDIFLHPILEDMVKKMSSKKSNVLEKSLNDMIAVEFNDASSILTSLNDIQAQKPNMFCIHGSDGGVFVFNELANHLENEFNIYGIGAQSTVHKNSISDIASSYLEQIKTQNSSHPPVICGFSSGGFVAWEIARQLEEMGEDLAQLILIDTQFLPHSLKDNTLLILVLFAYTFNLNIQSLPIEESLVQKVMNDTYTKEELNSIMKPTEEEFEKLFKKLVAHNGSLGLTYESLRQKFDIFQQYVDFSIGYDVPYLSHIDTLLLQAKQSAKNHQSWNVFGENIQHVEVEGNHMSCLQQPHVSFLSTTIQNFRKNNR